ncbi:MAG: hypothetical protein EBS05_21945 [Proteobacteria bacterium]|nr:hypothetical protein [Pseudomonadota bacterium]
MKTIFGATTIGGPVLRLVATLFLGLCAAMAEAAVTNDLFLSSTALVGATNVVTASNVGATKEPGEPDHAGDYGGTSVWWSWKAPANGPVVLHTEGSTFDTLLGVYTGTNVTALTLVASDDDRGGHRTSWLRFNATAGTVYQIAVDGWGGASGTIQLSVLQATPPPPVIVTQPVSLTNVIGTAAGFGVRVTGTRPLAFQWFKDGTALTNAAGPEYFIRHVQTNDAGTYWVVVSNNVGSVTSSNATLVILPPPANDNFANRIALTNATNSVIGSNVNASREDGEPGHAHERGGVSVWWSWTAPASGLVTVSTVGSTFDTLLGSIRARI